MGTRHIPAWVILAVATTACGSSTSGGGATGGSSSSGGIACMSAEACPQGTVCCASTHETTICQVGPCPSTIQLCSTAAECVARGDTCGPIDRTPPITLPGDFPVCNPPTTASEPVVDAATGIDATEDATADAPVERRDVSAGDGAPLPCTTDQDCPSGQCCYDTDAGGVCGLIECDCPSYVVTNFCK